MKLLFVVFASALALAAQDSQAKPPVRKSAPKEAAKAAPKVDDRKPLTIPSEAVADADGDYRYADSQGKKWIYRKTPFGVVRMEDTPERAAAQAAAVSGLNIKATENGDTVHFERLGPFGLWKWDKKKSELDATEKAALENSKANNQTASKQD